MSERRPMGSLEAQVLMQLWSRPDGATPAEVLEGLNTDLAYTTVMTILTRLWQKGLASRGRTGRAFVYRPACTEADLGAQRMRNVLDSTRDREAVLGRFVLALPKKDERVLRKLLGDG